MLKKSLITQLSSGTLNNIGVSLFCGPPFAAVLVFRFWCFVFCFLGAPLRVGLSAGAALRAAARRSNP